MRITNTMMTNSMLSRINKNMLNLDKYYMQMSSTKKIQMPSEDPILASRALRYRNIVSSTEQYYSNTQQANSWMEITESAYKNINSIYTKMSELCVQGATDSYNVDDRKKILNEFNSLVGQLEDELNVTYMGRYVFSGYKTDQPFIIEDPVTGKNILSNRIFGGKFDQDTADLINNGSVNSLNGLSQEIAQLNGRIASATDAQARVALEERRDGLITKMQKYVDVTVSDSKTNITINGATVVNGTSYNEFSCAPNNNADAFVLTVDGTEVPIDSTYGDLREDLLNTGIDGQDINLEIGVNNYITINSNGTKAYTQEIYDTLHEFDRIYDYINGDLSKEDIELYFNGTAFSDLNTSELASFDSSLRQSMEDMITHIKDFSSVVTEQHTNLGVRMNRLQLVQQRLEDDKVNYTSLMSQNEDINIATTTTEFNTAFTCYQAALKVGAGITQLTLVDYL